MTKSNELTIETPSKLAAPEASVVEAPGPPRGVHDMTTGSVRGHVVRMMLFVLAGVTLQTLYGLVDIYWVGKLGKEAVAAVALSSNLMFLSLAVTQTLSVGCVALVSQAAGKKEHAEVQHLFNQAQCLATCAGGLFLVATFAFLSTYAEKLSGDAATAELAKGFLVAFLPALALQFTLVGLGSALRGIGDMKPGLVAQTASVLCNMVLAPFLVFGWIGGHPLGVRGASLATLISTIGAVIGLAIYLMRGKTFLRLSFADWRPDFRVWGKMLGIGLPAGTEFLLTTVTIGAVYVVVRPFGSEAQAGYGIGSRLFQAGLMPAVAISFSVAAVVGQNFGSRAFARVREARRESSKLTLGFMVLFTALFQLVAEPIVAAFSASPAVVAAGAGYLRIVSLAYVASGIVFVSGGVFQGLGNTWPSLAASALRAILFVVPVFAMSHLEGFALPWIWWTSVAAVLLQLALQQTLLQMELRAKAAVSPAPRALGSS